MTAADKSLKNTYRVYILRCGDDTLYTGIARDVSARIREHESSTRGARYLRGRGPLKLVFDTPAESRSLAQQLESRIKKLPRNKKLQLANGDQTLLRLLRDGSL